ncbi:MAG: DEAD/DEAH box helicase, partial [Chloroflexi bacterium]|nr:DEAD/DEAH box helicase [Chloroflexota bacterium]
MCYNMPVLDAIVSDASTRALYLFPTKALAQDQLRALSDLQAKLPKPRFGFGAYDGDTPRDQRTAFRSAAHIVLTNPDMLSLGILPNHHLWSTYLSRLRFVVVDEAHVYRGVFGSHVACVLRRLLRICAAHGARPQFILASATIANPDEHAQRLTSRAVEVVSDDGSPRGAKSFVLWNPPFADRAHAMRRSATGEAAMLFANLARHGLRNITFARTRRGAELILNGAREQLAQSAPQLADRLRAYRAGYLTDERRSIEQQLFSGKLLGVTATNALELGVDIGQLDATVLVGYPGTVASVWQQAGRAGRDTKETLSILIAEDNPLDQFFVSHPDALFRAPVEHALIQPDNPHVLAKQLPSAAFELPLTSADEALFGGGFVDAMIALERSGVLEYAHERWHYRGQARYPAEAVSLRSATSRSVK